MSFSNQEYLYSNLPSRFRRDDEDLFLKRFTQFFGATLDEWDGKFDQFFENIQPDTADVEWIEVWLEVLFGWSWFPWWFAVSDKRRIYRNFARHLARRGTGRGIEMWLRDFGVIARVHTKPAPYGEFIWGETNYTTAEPLYILIEILGLISLPTDLSVWGEMAYGEIYYSDPRPPFTQREIADLIRYVEPHSQEILIMWRTLAKQEATPVYYWDRIDFYFWETVEW